MLGRLGGESEGVGVVRCDRKRLILGVGAGLVGRVEVEPTRPDVYKVLRYSSRKYYYSSWGLLGAAHQKSSDHHMLAPAA